VSPQPLSMLIDQQTPREIAAEIVHLQQDNTRLRRVAQAQKKKLTRLCAFLRARGFDPASILGDLADDGD